MTEYSPAELAYRDQLIAGIKSDIASLLESKQEEKDEG